MIKAKSLVLLGLEILCISTVAALSSIHAHAAGETLTWVDADTIRMTGDANGTFTGSTTIIGSRQYHGTFTTTSSGESCWIRGFITVPTGDTTRGKLTAIASSNVDQAGSGTTSVAQCPDSLIASYNNVSFDIGGTVNTSVETNAQKTAQVDVFSPLPPESSPGTISISATREDGVVVSLSASRNIFNGSANYSVDFLLQGTNTYTFSASGIDSVAPVTATKIEFEPLRVQLGNDTAYRSSETQIINVNIIATYADNPCTERTYGPIDVSAVDTIDERYVSTALSNSYTEPPSSLCANVGDSVIGTHTFHLNAVLEQVPPGDYFVCALSSCTRVTKVSFLAATVTITLSPEDAMEAATGEEAGLGERPLACEDVDGSTGWILCIFMSIVDDGIDYLDSAIINILRVDQIYNDDNNSLYNIWSTMRNIALALLIPIMLVMVLGTALSFGPFDAYTVKKALPRMIAAVIFITLSWQICTFMIDLSDIVGSGVIGFIENAGGVSARISLREIFMNAGNQTAPIAGGTFVAVLLGGFSAFLLGVVTFGIIISAAISAILALFIGYVSLAVRLIIILGLLVLSPIFILSWIFPGNDKMWKFWKTTFIGMLLLFPILTGAIGIGRLGAYIISTMG